MMKIVVNDSDESKKNVIWKESPNKKIIQLPLIIPPSTRSSTNNEYHTRKCFIVICISLSPSRVPPALHIGQYYEIQINVRRVENYSTNFNNETAQPTQLFSSFWAMKWRVTIHRHQVVKIIFSRNGPANNQN